jgi:hypothetical protein
MYKALLWKGYLHHLDYIWVIRKRNRQGPSCRIKIRIGNTSIRYTSAEQSDIIQHDICRPRSFWLRSRTNRNFVSALARLAMNSRFRIILDSLTYMHKHVTPKEPRIHKLPLPRSPHNSRRGRECRQRRRTPPILATMAVLTRGQIERLPRQDACLVHILARDEACLGSRCST